MDVNPRSRYTAVSLRGHCSRLILKTVEKLSVSIKCRYFLGWFYELHISLSNAPIILQNFICKQEKTKKKNK